MNMKMIDLTGKTFGFLTVIDKGPIQRTPNSRRSEITWTCLCKCGQTKNIRGGHLRSGHTTSCGCTWYQHGEKHHSWKGYKEISSRFFKSIIYNAEARNLSFDVTIEQLWDLFIKQDKKCALSGLPLTFSANHGKIKGNASLDRIDSSRGYTIDNVQWVHTLINNMKWDMPQSQFLNMCESVHRRQAVVS